MNRDNIEKKIIDIVSDELSIERDEISEQSNLSADLGADSLDAVEITMILEDEFDLSISDKDANNLINIKSIVDYIEKKLKE